VWIWDNEDSIWKEGFLQLVAAYRWYLDGLRSLMKIANGALRKIYKYRKEFQR